MLSFLSGAPVRVGFHRHTQEGLYRGDFINCPVLYNPYQHISQQFINLAEAIGWELRDTGVVTQALVAPSMHTPAFDARVEVPGGLLAPPVLIGIGVLAGLIWMLVRGSKLTRLSAAWFLLALVPVSNVLVPLNI